MPIWPYGTRVRAGAPTEINLGPSAFATYFQDTPAAWAAPIAALFPNQTMLTSELCAVQPPPDEQWTINDMLSAMAGPTQAFTISKLVRMAKAAVWNTYCEFNEGPTSQAAVIPAYGMVGYFGLPGDPSAFVATAPIGDHGQNFYTLETINLGISGQAMGEIQVGPSSGPTSPFIIVADSSTTTPHERTLYPGDNLGTSGDPYIFGPTDTHWYFTTEAGSTTMRPWAIQYWTMTGLPIYETVPPPVVPWDQAPQDPFIGPVNVTQFQFTWEQVALLVEAANSQIDNQYVADNTYVTVNDIWAFLQGMPGAPVGGFTILPPESGILLGSNVLTIPPEMCGIGIYVNPPDYVARRGVEPEAMFDVGHYALGADNGWLTSVALKHSPHLVYPFPDGISRIAIDLSPNVWSEYFWLQKNT